MPHAVPNPIVSSDSQAWLPEFSSGAGAPFEPATPVPERT